MQKSDPIEGTAGLSDEIAVERQRPPHLPARGKQAKQSERYVVLERIAGKQCDDLVGARKPQMRATVGRKRGNVGAEQPDLSGIRPHVAVDLVEERGLAGAVRPDDQAAFALPDCQRYVLGDPQSAEGFVQADDL